MKSKKKSSFVAHDRQDFILAFMDSSCRFTPCCDEVKETVESVKREIEELDESIADWESIIDYERDDPETTRINRAGLQRAKMDKVIAKKKLKILLSMENNAKAVAYSA